jgi:lactoylglutathione lyase
MTAIQTRNVLGHVGLNVTDLVRSKSFYQDVFGFDASQQSDEKDRRFVFLTQDGELVLTLWEQSEGSFAGDRPGLHHLSFQVASIQAVRDAERRLNQLGVHIYHDGVVPHARGAESGGVFFDDPDGIRLEISADSGFPIDHEAPFGEAPTCGFF